MSRRIPRVVSLAGAAIGLGLGGFVASRVSLPVPPDQLAGFAASKGFNARGPVLAFGFVCLAAFAGAVLAGFLWQRWSRSGSLPASPIPSLGLGLKIAIPICLALGLMVILLNAHPRRIYLFNYAAWLALAAAAPLAKGTASERHIGFVSAVAHALTLWIFLAAFAPKWGLSPLSLGALLLAFSLLQGYWLGGRNLEKGAPLLALAALTIPIGFWSGRTESICLFAACAGALLPIAGLGVPDLGRGRRWLKTLTVSVFLPGSVVALGAAACLHGPPVANFFEDGHGLLPASEYLRGRLPYRDIVPGHGLISDGALQTAELRAFGEDYRGIATGTKVVGILFWPAVYAVGVAATGSAAIGFWSVCLSFLAFPQFSFFRVIASLGCLALAACAARTGRRSVWVLTGAALPLALLFSIDFWVYSVTAVAVALAISRGPRRRAATGFLVGFLSSCLLIGIAFAALHILGGFLYYTFAFIPRLYSAYTLGTPPPPPGLVNHLLGVEALVSLTDFQAVYYWLLIAAVVVTASLLPRTPAVGARGRAVLPLLVWFCAATLSVLERHHFGYAFFVAPTAIVLLARWVKSHAAWRSLRGALAGSLIGILIVASRLGSLYPSLVFGLMSSDPPPGTEALSAPPRARGAVFHREEANAIAATGKFLDAGLLGPQDTWLDFSNAPLLYFLFDRRCPIRYYEVPFYQSAEAQTEVVGAIRRNPNVRAVLIRTGQTSDYVDGIPNHIRAPIVFEYISKEFQPSFAQEGVEFWLRRSTPTPVPDAKGR